MAKAVSVDCPNCGAQLNVDPASPQATCQYCNTTSMIQRGNKPPGKLPQWQPPPGAQIPYGAPRMGHQMPVPMVIHVPQARFSTAWIWITLLAVLVPLLATMIPVFMSTGLLSRGWDGEEPFSCGGNDRFEIDGVKAKFKGTTAMNIGGNCQVELRNVDIEGKVGANVSGNGRLTLFSGSIEGATTGIEVGVNGRVVLHKGTVKGGGYAIDASVNAQVQTGDAKIKGKKKTSLNARIDGKAY